MEWSTIRHLGLRHVGREDKALQPHAAAFHPNQALIAAAVGKYIIEFDAITGSKVSTIDIGSPVVRMSYSPTSGHAVIAILEDCTVRSCDFDSEQTCVLHSPEKKTEPISSEKEVYLALTPLQPVVFFGFHKRMSVTGCLFLERICCEKAVTVLLVLLFPCVYFHAPKRIGRITQLATCAYDLRRTSLK